MSKKQYKKKSEVNVSNFTLDSKHMKYVKHNNQQHNQLASKKKQLKDIEDQIIELDKDKSVDNYLFQKMNLVTTKETLENKINEISSFSNETSYYRNVHNILNEYYDSNNDNYTNKINNTKLEINHTEDCDEHVSSNILNYYNLDNTDNNDDEINNTEYQDETIRKNNNLNDYIETTRNFDKANLLNEYMCIIDNSHIQDQIETVDNITFCVKCNIEKTIIQAEGTIVCRMCGDSIEYVTDSEKPTYKEPLQETSYFCYKRINHFNEWLSQFQAKESTEIPDFVYEQILREIKKLRISNMNKLTPSKMREILKKLKLNKYYEHVPHIINKLSGLPPPIMSRDVEDKLRHMFKEIQEPFIEICPKDRKNFLSYSYVLHKMCELLGLDEFLNCFPLLKSREKLHNQDIMWKQITQRLNWQFIPSI